MSKLKTVWDAVNELRGNLNNTPNFSGGEMYLFHFVNHDRIGSSYGKHGLDGVINHICTVDEFNALVEDMTLGLDVNPVNHGHYLNYVDADKTLLKKESEVDYTSEEFWKDAPEGATHYWSWSQSFYKFSDYDEDFVFNNDSWELCSDISCFGSDGLFEYPQSTPTETPEEKEALDSIVNKPLVYTQEMADNGELPSVGMECMAKRFHESDNGLMISFIIGTNKELDYMVFERGNKLEQHHIVNGVWEFSPIDTRTKKEKAIDEFMAENLRGGIEFKHLISKAYDKWVGE
tara:strand:- start:1954 stop:2823 length:870 start_codon:yes stop_codon:yes gene_type:complete